MHKRNIICWWLRLKNCLCSICINLPWRDFAIYWWVHGKVFMRISKGIPYGNKIARLIMMMLLRQWHLAYPNLLWIQKCIIIQRYANCKRCSKTKAQLFNIFITLLIQIFGSTNRVKIWPLGEHIVWLYKSWNKLWKGSGNFAWNLSGYRKRSLK